MPKRLLARIGRVNNLTSGLMILFKGMEIFTTVCKVLIDVFSCDCGADVECFDNTNLGNSHNLQSGAFMLQVFSLLQAILC